MSGRATGLSRRQWRREGCGRRGDVLQDQIKHGARLIGRWMKANSDDTVEIFAIWEYDSHEAYARIELDVAADEAHSIRIRDWYEKNGGRERVYQDYILEVKNEFLESTLRVD